MSENLNLNHEIGMDTTETVIDTEEDKERDKNLKDFQALFKPFTIVQALFILSKYKIENNVIKPNSTFYNILSAIFSIALLLCHNYITFRPFYVDEWDETLLAKYVCSIQETPLLWLATLMNVYTNILHTQNNAIFAVKMQNVCGILRNNGGSIHTFIILNWFNIVSVISFQITWILIFKYAFSSIYHTYELVGNMVYIIFDTNIVYTITVMRFLSKAFLSWIDETKKCQLAINCNSKHFWNKMFRDYVDIYEAYEIAAKVLNPLYTFTAVISLFWLYKDVLLFILLSLECEKLYTKMKEVQNICIQIAASEANSDIQQNTYKNIVRHQIVSFKKMKICGLFAVDAALMMRFASLITTNIIIVHVIKLIN
ncbi:hypothetical protein SFRURICE_016988 [Spodoptera frugiperda]|nr:hypothetical protein SFRURICE_016988 [Spodoptera frugiperda]